MFQGQLDQLCDISATDAYEQLARSRRPHWKEDFALLENQRGSRTFYMTQLDSNASELARRQLANKSKYQDQKQKSSTSHLSLTDDEIRRQLEELSSDDETERQAQTEEFTPSYAKKRKTATVSLNIPSKQLSEVVAPAADRSGLSIRQQLLIQSTIVMNSGGTLDAMSMSVSTVWRQRRTARYRRNLNLQF
jgi:hypothetical protein